MNGIDALAVATGNDWRAIEAGAHAYACRGGSYGSLTTWAIDEEHLVGAIELPMAVSTVGPVVDSHPRVRLALRMLGVSSARELAAIMAAVGLASNLAALRALVTEGIQREHMALHARAVSHAAGARRAGRGGAAAAPRRRRGEDRPGPRAAARPGGALVSGPHGALLRRSRRGSPACARDPRRARPCARAARPRSARPARPDAAPRTTPRCPPRTRSRRGPGPSRP